MKAQLVSENLDFERGRDPKTILNIGVLNMDKVFNNTEDLIEWLIFILPILLDTKKIPEDIIEGKDDYIHDKYFDKIYKYINNKIKDFDWDIIPQLNKALRKLGYKE